MVRSTGMTLTCQFSNPIANAPQPTTMNCTIATSPNVAGTNEVFIPTTENWIITDMYIVNSSDQTTGNPMIEFIKDRGISMGVTTPLGTELISNNTRPRFLPAPIGYEAGSILTMQAISTIAFGTALETATFFVAVDIT